MDKKDKSKIKNDILFLTLIGKEIEIVNSKIISQIGVCGTIINETNNFIEILLKNGEIKSLKKSIIVFQIILKGQPLNIDGDLLLNTLTQRIKKLK